MGSDWCSYGPRDEDPTFVIPDHQPLITLINKLDSNILVSLRKTQKEGLSLILPASKNSKHSLIIRYYLLYSYYLNKYNGSTSDRTRFQEYFFSFLTQTYRKKADSEKAKQEQAEALKLQYDKMKDEYSKALKTSAAKASQDKLSLLILKSAMKGDFILEHVNKVLLAQKDPKALSYFMFPIHALHSAIINSFKRPDITRKDPLWIVAVLQDKQIDMLKQMKNTENYFFFSAFMRGFTDQKCARQQFKTLRQKNQKNTFLFTVNFPYQYTKLRTEENKGFYICKDATPQLKKSGDVIFNIMNSFKLSSQTSTYEFDIDYGELARLFYLKTNERTSSKEPLLVRIYETCRGLSKFYLKSQSCLCRIISGKEQIRGLQNLVKTRNKDTQNIIQAPVNDIERYNVINTIFQSGDYQKALINVGKTQNLLLKAKKIHILYEIRNFEAAQAEIRNIPEAELEKTQNLEARIIIEVVRARAEMRKRNFEQAHSRLLSLYNTLYQHHFEDFQFIGRDVVSALIECEQKGGSKVQIQDVVKRGAGGYDQIDCDDISLSSISISRK